MNSTLFAGRLGIEPRLRASKAPVLPLDDLPALHGTHCGSHFPRERGWKALLTIRRSPNENTLAFYASGEHARALEAAQRFELIHICGCELLRGSLVVGVHDGIGVRVMRKAERVPKLVREYAHELVLVLELIDVYP